MYAASPIFGWLSDAWGTGKTTVLGRVLLAAACLLAGTAGDSVVQITAGLILLGLGWSAAVIAGAALLTSHTETSVRPLVQGFSDMSMSVAGAVGSVIAGVVVWGLSFEALTAVATLALVPVLISVARTRRFTLPSSV